ncbi:cytochrome c oxidase subunit 1, partial [Nowakowskiella sp. JEL0078]
MQNDSGKTPLWNKFWDSALSNPNDVDPTPLTSPSESDADTPSEVASPLSTSQLGTRSQLSHSSTLPVSRDNESVAPDDSASMFGVTKPKRFTNPRKLSLVSSRVSFSTPERQQLSPVPDTFVFKVRDEDSGKVHRVTAATSNLQDLIDLIAARITWTAEEALELSYVDDDGDFIHLATSSELVEAVTMARGLGWHRLIVSIDAQRERHHTLGAVASAARILGSAALGSPVVGRHDDFEGGWSDVGSVATVTVGKRRLGYPQPTALYDHTGRLVRGSGMRRDGGGGGREGDGDTNEKEEVMGPVLVGAGVAVV